MIGLGTTMSPDQETVIYFLVRRERDEVDQVGQTSAAPFPLSLFLSHPAPAIHVNKGISSFLLLNFEGKDPEHDPR
jgi:hypothetical protein